MNLDESWANREIGEPKILRINHYFTKSKEEWISRRSQGRADTASLPDIRTLDEFYAHDNNDIYDQIGKFYANLITKARKGELY